MDLNHIRFTLLFQMLKDRPTIDGRPGESLEPLDFDALKAKLEDDFGEIEYFGIYLLCVNLAPSLRGQISTL